MKVWVLVRHGRGLATDEILHVFADEDAATSRIAELVADPSNAIYDFSAFEHEVQE